MQSAIFWQEYQMPKCPIWRRKKLSVKKCRWFYIFWCVDSKLLHLHHWLLLNKECCILPRYSRIALFYDSENPVKYFNSFLRKLWWSLYWSEQLHKALLSGKSWLHVLLWPITEQPGSSCLKNASLIGPLGSRTCSFCRIFYQNIEMGSSS